MAKQEDGSREPEIGMKSAALADIVLPDVDGHDVRLGSLWEKGPAVVAFLRHYG